MSSRQEEKERRRKEREEAERAAAVSSARRKRIAMVGGAVLAAAVAVIAVLALVSGDDEGSNQTREVASAEPPPQRIENLNQAVEAAGCKLDRHRNQGRDHTTETVRYDTNPPTSGPHDPTPSQDGIYEPGNSPDVEQSVHALEHGRINFQYRKGTSARDIGRIAGMVEEEVKGTEGYHSLLFENQTNMDAAVAATAWTRSLTCPTLNNEAFDALRAFRRDFVDKGPEFIP